MEQFVENVKRRFPHALLQWEDFAQRHAAPILLRYRDELLSFNDDIQGTAAVTLAALRSAFRGLGSRLSDHRFCIVGAGSAGTGIAQMIRDVIAAESGADDPVSLIFMTDRKGLIHEGRDDLTASKRAFAQPDSVIATWGVRGTPSLEDVVANARPTVLVGVHGQPGLFSERVVRQMLEWTIRPIVMPMSNPTSRSEGVPSDILRWTGGRALVATGSPFDDVDVGDSPIRISQSNNVYVFPGVGLGVILAKARKVTDAMLVAAAASLAEDAPRKPEEGLLPPIESVADTSRHVALAVAKAARDEGVAAGPHRRREPAVVGGALLDSGVSGGQGGMSRVGARHWGREHRRGEAWGGSGSCAACGIGHVCRSWDWIDGQTRHHRAGPAAASRRGERSHRCCHVDGNSGPGR